MGRAALAVSFGATAFFYGTLCHPPLLATVLQRQVELRPATMPDHVILRRSGGDGPVLVGAPGAAAPGAIVRELTEGDLARLDFFTGMYGARRGLTTVFAPGPEEVVIWSVDPATGPQGGPWHLDDWVRRWGDVTVATVADAMALYGQAEPITVGGRMPLMMVRGASRLRATQIRGRRAPGDATW